MNDEIDVPGTHELLRVLGSHWNQTHSRDDGTGVIWDKNKKKWVAKVVRTLGEFDSAEDAGRVLQLELLAVEEFILDSIANGGRITDTTRAFLGGRGIAQHHPSEKEKEEMDSRV